MNVVFDETKPKLQYQVSKNADDEDIFLEKQSGTVIQSVEKDKTIN